jgi:hypothetical protein
MLSHGFGLPLRGPGAMGGGGGGGGGGSGPASQVGPPTGGARAETTRGPIALRWNAGVDEPAIDEELRVAGRDVFTARPKAPHRRDHRCAQRLPEP